MTGLILPPSVWDTGPTCVRCSDWVRGYAAGWADAQAMIPTCEHVHPAIAASVAEMFGGWDGVAAAHQRSIHRFRLEQRGHQRKAAA